MVVATAFGLGAVLVVESFHESLLVVGAGIAGAGLGAAVLALAKRAGARADDRRGYWQWLAVVPAAMIPLASSLPKAGELAVIGFWEGVLLCATFLIVSGARAKASQSGRQLPDH
jgi:hypothetical protein